MYSSQYILIRQIDKLLWFPYNTRMSKPSFLAMAKHLAVKPYMIFLFGALLGFLYFTAFYGLKIVNPFFTDWLMGGGDIKQHFIGWEFYRHEAWAFPIGAIESLAYPFGIALTFTDSIPIVAILLKPFEGMLPDSFQYIGMWGVLCYMLQGGIAALIMRRWTNNIFVILLCSTIFIVAPIFMARMFVHTALASQWLLLLAIWVMLEKERFAGIKKFVLVWSGIFGLAATIHPYFLPMVALPFAIALIRSHDAWLLSLLKFTIPLVITALVFWAIGGLVVETDETAAGGLGDYALNLNSLFNPITSSKFLPGIPNYSTSGETLNYLGMGILLLLPVVLFIFLQKFKDTKQPLRLARKFNVRHGLVALSVLGLTLAAISPSFQFGVKELFVLDTPTKIEQYWSIFRASARLFWIVYYLIVVGVLAYIIKSWRGKSSAMLAAFLLPFTVLQVMEVHFSPLAKNKRGEFAIINEDTYQYKPQLKTSDWRGVVEGKKHLVYMGKMTEIDFFPIVDIALKYKLTMNTGYFARQPEADVARYLNMQKDLLLKHKADKENLFVTKDTSIVKTLRDSGYTVTRISGYYVVN